MNRATTLPSFILPSGTGSCLVMIHTALLCITAFAAPLGPQEGDVTRMSAADRVVAFNKLMEAVPGENSAEHYRKADAAFVELSSLADKTDSALLKKAYQEAEQNLHDIVCKEKWTSNESLAMRSWLKANAGALQDLKAATDCPRFSWVVSIKERERFSEVVIQQLPLQTLRRSMKLLSAAAAEAAMRGAWNEAYDWNRRAMQVANHAFQLPLVVGQLVAVASEAYVGRQLLSFLGRQTPGDWDAVASVLRSGGQSPELDRRVEMGERLYTRDHIEACHAWAGNPQSEPGMNESVGFLFRKDASIKELKALAGDSFGESPFHTADEFKAALKKSSLEKDWAVQERIHSLFEGWCARRFHEAWRDADKFHDEVCRTQAQAPSLMLYGCGRSSTTQVRVLMQSGAMHRQALLACIALHRWHQQKGKWPERLTELVPDLLASEPLDVFTGRQLIYRVNPDGRNFILYSVGRDMKDDGGKRAPTLQQAGDQVFWPPQPPASTNP